MRKKLILLNAILIGSVAYIAHELRDVRRASLQRQRAVDAVKVKPAPAPPVTVPPPQSALQASGYLDVAQQTLFTKDRNPNIVVEPEKPPVPPPFPRFYGVMNLGDGLMAILSDGPGKQRPFKAGEKAGPLLLAEIGKDSLVFEWEKQKLTKKFSELQERAPEVSQPGDTTRTAVSTPQTPGPQQIAASSPNRAEPGVDIGGGVASCLANDTSPAGTVTNGKRKVVTESPFGKICRWEPVK